MRLDPIRQAMEHLEVAHRLLEPYYVGRTAKQWALVDALAFHADSATLEAFNYCGGALEHGEEHAAAVYTAERLLEV